MPSMLGRTPKSLVKANEEKNYQMVSNTIKYYTINQIKCLELCKQKLEFSFFLVKCS